MGLRCWASLLEMPEQNFNLCSLPITRLLNQINFRYSRRCPMFKLHYLLAVNICIPKPDFLKIVFMKIYFCFFRAQKRQGILVGKVRWEVPLACSPIILWRHSGFFYFFFSIKRNPKNILVFSRHWLRFSYKGLGLIPLLLLLNNPVYIPETLLNFSHK